MEEVPSWYLRSWSSVLFLMDPQSALSCSQDLVVVSISHPTYCFLYSDCRNTENGTNRSFVLRPTGRAWFSGHLRIIVVLFVRHRAILSDVFRARAPYRFLLSALYYTNCYQNICRRNFRILWVIHPSADIFYGRLIFDVPRSHTISHTHNRFDSSDRVISSSLRSLTTQQAKDTRES